jgi:probable phosphoglycerate mutase
MAMRLVLVRHGRSQEGVRDPSLDDAGRREAQAVAAWLAREGVTRIVSSPLRRARETAKPLAARVGIDVDVIEGWAEADRHRNDYRSVETLRRESDSEWRRFLADPVAYMGMDPRTFRAGVLAALRSTIEAGPPDARVAVFTHGLPINVALAQALGLERLVHFAPTYGSITRVHASDAESVRVVSINETGHLAERHEQVRA